MIKLVLKAKKKINGILNLRNISMLNNINMNKKFIKDIPLTYKNKNIGLCEVFSINIPTHLWSIKKGFHLQNK